MQNETNTRLQAALSVLELVGSEIDSIATTTEESENFKISMKIHYGTIWNKIQCALIDEELLKFETLRAENFKKVLKMSEHISKLK